MQSPLHFLLLIYFHISRFETCLFIFLYLTWTTFSCHFENYDERGTDDKGRKFSQDILKLHIWLVFVLLTALKRDQRWAIQCENLLRKKSYIFIYLQLPILFISHRIGRVGEIGTMISQLWTILKEMSCI